MKKGVFLHIFIFLLLINIVYSLVPDEDKDGVPDANDKCPNSETHVVDQFGCSCAQKNCPSDDSVCTDDCGSINGLASCGAFNNDNACPGGYCLEGQCIREEGSYSGNCRDKDRLPRFPNGDQNRCSGTPILTSLSPASLKTGEILTLHGSDLGRTVLFFDENNIRSSYNWADGIEMSEDRTQVTVPIPPELLPGNYRIRVWLSTTPEVVSNELPFTIESDITTPKQPSQFAFDPENSGRSSFKGPQASNAKLLFKDTPGPGCGRQVIMTTPVLDSQGNLYFGTSEGSLIAINTKGQELWRFKLPDVYPRNNCDGEGGEKGMIGDHNIEFMPASDGTNVYFGTSGIGNAKRVYALGLDGKEKWRLDIDGPLHSPIKIGYDNRLYFTTLDTLYSVDNTGADVKKYQITEGSKYPAISKSNIYVCSGQSLVALNYDLVEVWKLNAGTNLNNCKPAVNPDTGIIYFVVNNRDSNDYKLYAVSPDGKLQWTVDVFWSEAPPAVAKDGTIYVSAVDLSLDVKTKPTSGGGRGNGELFAINPDGTVKWRYNVPPQLVCKKGTDEDCPNNDLWSRATSIDASPTIGADGAIYFGTDAQRYFALSQDGTLKWVYKNADEWDNSVIITPDGTMYTGPRGNLGGGLYIFSDSLPAQSENSDCVEQCLAGGEPQTECEPFCSNTD